jgi:hypothetical protein
MPTQLDDKLNFILFTLRTSTLDVPEEDSVFEKLTIKLTRESAKSLYEIFVKIPRNALDLGVSRVRR